MPLRKDVRTGKVPLLPLILVFVTLLSACGSAADRTEDAAPRFERRTLPEPEWFEAVKDTICVAGVDGAAQEVLDASNAPDVATSGDAPCLVTSDVSGGGAIFDFSDDGVPDIIWTPSLLGSPVFLENMGDWEFRDVSTEMGSGMDLEGANGMAIGDVDNDGKADIFFTGYARTSAILLMNKGGGPTSSPSDPTDTASPSRSSSHP